VSSWSPVGLISGPSQWTDHRGQVRWCGTPAGLTETAGLPLRTGLAYLMRRMVDRITFLQPGFVDGSLHIHLLPLWMCRNEKCSDSTPFPGIMKRRFRAKQVSGCTRRRRHRPVGVISLKGGYAPGYCPDTSVWGSMQSVGDRGWMYGFLRQESVSCYL